MHTRRLMPPSVMSVMSLVSTCGAKTKHLQQDKTKLMSLVCTFSPTHQPSYQSPEMKMGLLVASLVF